MHTMHIRRRTRTTRILRRISASAVTLGVDVDQKSIRYIVHTSYIFVPTLHGKRQALEKAETLALVPSAHFSAGTAATSCRMLLAGQGTSRGTRHLNPHLDPWHLATGVRLRWQDEWLEKEKQSYTLSGRVRKGKEG